MRPFFLGGADWLKGRPRRWNMPLSYVLGAWAAFFGAMLPVLGIVVAVVALN